MSEGGLVKDQTLTDFSLTSLTNAQGRNVVLGGVAQAEGVVVRFVQCVKSPFQTILNQGLKK